MNSSSRRDFLKLVGCGTAGAALFPRLGRGADLTSQASGDAAAAAEKAHKEIWRRFVDQHGVMLDFAGLDGAVIIPTPEECKLGKPNALGWGSPIENGAMFNGLYLDAVINRWRHTQAAADAAKATKLADGLLFLSSLSELRGFIGRGVATDGRAHYAMGSDDQTLPWFLGLWRYLETGLAIAEQRTRITAKLVEVADEIVSRKWMMPAEQPFGIRGGFAGFAFHTAPRLLFVAKLMHVVTHAVKWDALYREALMARGGKDKRSRLEICERGMVFEFGGRHSWISGSSVAALRALWDLEQDTALRATYARGLQASADLAMESLPLAEKFDNTNQSRFEPDWRKMNTLWKPQHTEAEAVKLAEAQLTLYGKLSPRRGLESSFVREPTAAAWIVTLAPDPAILRQRAAAVARVIAHYDYARLYSSQFFWAEAAWWRLQ